MDDARRPVPNGVTYDGLECNAH